MDNWREKIISLLNLEENWDSYGGSPPDQAVARRAIALIEDVGFSPKNIVPLNDGGIQMDFVAENIIEAEVLSDETYGYLYIPDVVESSTWREGDNLTHDQLVDFILDHINKKAGIR